jgi:hypothetical protein
MLNENAGLVTETRPRLGIAHVMRGTGNAAQYQASVLNFAPTWINLS